MQEHFVTACKSTGIARDETVLPKVHYRKSPPSVQLSKSCLLFWVLDASLAHFLPKPERKATTPHLRCHKPLAL